MTRGGIPAGVRRLVHVVLAMSILTGFTSQASAAATACRAGIMQLDSSMKMSESMLPRVDSSRGEDSQSGDPCSSPTTAHACPVMSACLIMLSDIPDVRVEACISPRSYSVASLVPELKSRTILPELPPPRLLLQ